MKLFSLFLLLVASSLAALNVKHLSGAPEEFGLHSLPDPRDSVTSEKSYTENVWFTAGADDVVYERDFPVDGPKDFVFTLATPHADSLELQMLDPSGHPIDLKSAALQTYWPLGDVKLPMTAYVIQNSVPGIYKLTMKSTLSKDEITTLSASVNPNAALTLLNNDDVEIRSHLSSYIIKVGAPIGVVSTIVDVQSGALPVGIKISSAVLDIVTPNGVEIEIPMSDNEDFIGAPPQTGVYGAQIDANVPGDYVFLSKLQGTFQDATLEKDIAFERTSQYLVKVSPATVELDGTARLRKIPADAKRVNIDLGVKGGDNQPQLRGYTEVWGVHAQTKELVPVCWVGGLVPVVNGYATLVLDLNWLHRAGVSGLLTLKNAYLADIDTNFGVSRFESNIAVDGSDFLVTPRAELLNMVATEEMSFGKRPAELTVNATAIGLLLIHGYCAGTNPWATNPGDFTNAYYPLWSLANDSHDQYSKRVMQYAQDKGLTGFSLIGHSQGGTVGAHLRNFYWSGLDSVSGGHLIQSVGTPYRGCTGAGSAANLIKIFGVGCGANSDLTVDASVSWLAGIASLVRKDIAYYTSTYQQGNFFGDYCNMAVNMVLEWPNDGVTEESYAKLVGGTYMGNTQKQCHTTDMAYPAQYNDRSRNQEMNRNAARA